MVVRHWHWTVQTYYDKVDEPESAHTDLRLEQGKYNFATQQEQNEFSSYQFAFLGVPLMMNVVHECAAFILKDNDLG